MRKYLFPGDTRLWLLLPLSILIMSTVPSIAVEPSEMLADPAQEARARELSKGLRCVVCRNQSIDDSNAGIARDLRIALRERIRAGDDDAQAVQFLVDRYGTYILLKPPFRLTTYLLWIGPILMLIAAIFGFRKIWGNPGVEADEVEEFSSEDQAMINKILYDKDRT